MKIGIISDVHGDVVALDQALGHLRGMGCQPILCAGDLIDGEPLAEEVIARLRAERVTCVLGNHERWALDRHSPEARAFGSGTELSDEDLAWLGTLPARWSAELAGVRVVMTHGDAEGAMPQSCPTFLAALLLDLHADVLVVGHVHEPFVIATSAGLVVNPGPCCRSTYAFERSGPILVPSRYREATFGVLDLPERRFTVCRADNG